MGMFMLEMSAISTWPPDCETVLMHVDATLVHDDGEAEIERCLFMCLVLMMCSAMYVTYVVYWGTLDKRQAAWLIWTSMFNLASSDDEFKYFLNGDCKQASTYYCPLSSGICSWRDVFWLFCLVLFYPLVI